MFNPSGVWKLLNTGGVPSIIDEYSGSNMNPGGVPLNIYFTNALITIAIEPDLLMILYHSAAAGITNVSA